MTVTAGNTHLEDLVRAVDASHRDLSQLNSFLLLLQ